MTPFRNSKFEFRIGPARIFVLALTLGVLAAPLAAEAQQTAKVYRIGWLGNASLTSPEFGRLWEAFLEGLRERGYVEGQNLVVERRSTGGRIELSSSLAAELVDLKVDLIVAVGTAGVRAAKQATNVIPIVMVFVLDPVAGGLVDSLSRPGGNVTGPVFAAGLEIVGKHLALLKEAVPTVSRVAVLSDPTHPLDADYRREAQAAAGALGVTLQFYEFRDPNELESTFTAMAKARAGAILGLAEPFAYVHAKRIAGLAAKSRLPGMFAFRESAEAGGLMAYAGDAPDMFRRAAYYVDKILRGAKPADLPIEQPTKFELVINIKTAKALGLTIPQSILIRADEVIR